jgi:PhnB protein
MKFEPCLALHFDGRCEAAFKFYERCLGGKIEFMMRWSESPMANQAAPDWQAKLLHARISFGDTEVVGGDVLPEQYEKPIWAFP